MKFKAGDPVWVTALGTDVIPKGTVLAAVVLQPFPAYNVYSVEIPQWPSHYPGDSVNPKGIWCPYEYQLSPRGDGYDGLQTGEWELCPWKPAIKQPVTI